MKFLACSINIFDDRDIIKFLNKDFESNYIQDLRQVTTLYFERMERMEVISGGLSSNSKYDVMSGNKGGNESSENKMQNLIPFDFKIFGNSSLSRRRG